MVIYYVISVKYDHNYILKSIYEYFQSTIYYINGSYTVLIYVIDHTIYIEWRQSKLELNWTIFTFSIIIYT